jgi:hypothetical protein
MNNVPPTPPPATPPAPEPPQEMSPETRRALIMGGIFGVVIIIAIIAAIVWMLQPGNATSTATIRDIFIIGLAFESLFIGMALIILMIQIARLTNLLQHEIKPILQNTNDTINTVRTTAAFVSENLVDPVMKLNGYLSAIGKFFDLINIVNKK